MTPAERLAARLEPDVLEKLLRHLEAVKSPGRSEVILHHGPAGKARKADIFARIKVPDEAPAETPS